MKATLDTARHFLPVGTAGEICHDYNRAALVATMAARARALGLGPSMTAAQMAGLAQLVRDDERSPVLSARTRAAIRSALRPALSPDDDPADVAAAVFGALPDTPVCVRGADGREYFLVAVPVP